MFTRTRRRAVSLSEWTDAMLQSLLSSMNTEQKLRLDRVVGTPLAWATNLAARVLGKLLQRDHATDPASVRHIAVHKVLGLGSIIQATPLLAALRASFPQADITLLTSRRNRELVERLPLVDRGLYLADDSVPALVVSTAAAIRSLMRERIDLFFDLELYSAAASVVSALSCARNRYGFYRHSATFKKGSYTHLVKFATNKPVSRLYMQLALAAGAREVPDHELGPITVHAEDHRRLAETLRAAGAQLADEYIAVNPNASDLLLERRWPVERFAALIERLAQERRQCVILGGPGERQHVAGLLARLSADARRSVIDTCGRLTLGELLALIAGARCVVTNDSGPMHFAFALRRPTVSLFGPVDPLHYGFATATVETLYHPVFCSPCVHEKEPPPCGGNNICMQLISPDEALAAVHRLLGLPAARRPSLPPPRYVDLEGRALGIIARVSLPSSMPVELAGEEEGGEQRERRRK
jgi:ADP-heptose:LPS heptosyltransferase